MKSDIVFHFNDCLSGKMLDSNGKDNHFYFVNTLDVFNLGGNFGTYISISGYNIEQ